MGATAFGIYAFAWVVVILAGTLAQAGFSVSVVRFLNEHREAGRPDLAAGAVRFALAVVVAAGLAVAAAGAVGVRLSRGWLEPALATPLLLAFAAVPLYALSELGKGVARAGGSMVAAYAPGFLARPLLVLVILGALYGLGAAASASLAMAAVAAAALLTAAAQWAWLAAGRRRAGSPRSAAYAGRRWLLVSLPLVVGDLYFLMMAHVDVVMLNAFVAPAEVAVYFASAKTAALLSFVFFAVSAAAAAPLARLHAAGRDADLAATLHTFIAWSFWPSLAGAALLLAAGPFVLGLFGGDFAAGYPLLAVLLAGLLVQAATGPLKFLLGMTGGHNAMAIVMAAAILLNIGLNALLIPAFGPMGAALATVASTFASTLALVVVVRLRLGLWSVVGGAAIGQRAAAADPAAASA